MSSRPSSTVIFFSSRCAGSTYPRRGLISTKSIPTKCVPTLGSGFSDVSELHDNLNHLVTRVPVLGREVRINSINIVAQDAVGRGPFFK
jgi:hypothetical protein